MTNTEKADENKLRRAARRRGLLIIKSKRRDSKAKDFNRYAVVEESQLDYSMTKEELEAFLLK